MSRVIVVTGTDTGVGKTLVTAALAVRALARGTAVAVKPVQTGIGPEAPAEPADVDEVQRLAGCDVQEFTRMAEPLAPDTAARTSGVPIPSVPRHIDRIRELRRAHDTVVVEGAGGLLVRLDTEGGTLLDLAATLVAEVYVVCRAGLGTLNHAELTVLALRSRGIEPAGLVIGSWPSAAGLAERCNRIDLPRVTGVPLVGTLPARAGRLSAAEFRAAVPTWLPDA